MQSKRVGAGVAVCSALFAAGTAEAGGFEVSELSARGLGRANAGEVADGGAGSLWWNPAAIARTPREAVLGVAWRDTSASFSDRGSTMDLPVPPAGLTVPVGGAAQVSDGVPELTALNAAAAMPIGDRFALGLSVNRPFRLKTELGEGAWSRYDTVRSRIEVANVQLTGAVQVTDWLDLGLSFNAQRTEAGLDQAFPNLAPGAADGLFQLAADGWAYGWGVGAQARQGRLSLGASYRSAVKHELDGGVRLSGLVAPLDGANFASPATAAFSTPWTAIVGARWAATPALTLSGQVERAGWSEYDAIAVSFAGQTVSIPQNFRDTTSAAVGLDYRLGAMWTVRTGVRIDPTPTPDSLREPGVPDSDRWTLALGASAELTPAVTLHGAVAYADFDAAGLRDDDVFYAGTPARTTVHSRGVYSGDALSAAASVNVRF